MSKTPRTDEHLRMKEENGHAVIVSSDFSRQLEAELADKDRQLAEARAEIESKSRLIEQMREALRAADDLIDEYTADYEHRDNVDEIREEIKAALAAERGE